MIAPEIESDKLDQINNKMVEIRDLLDDTGLRTVRLSIGASFHSFLEVIYEAP